MADKMTSSPGAYDDHTSPHSTSTPGQVALGLVWAAAMSYSLVAVFFGKHLQSLNHRFTEYKDPEKAANDTEKAVTKPGVLESVVAVKDGPKDGLQGDINQNNPSVQAQPTAPPPSNVPPTPTFIQVVHRLVLFGFILFLFYLSDYKKVVPATPRVYNEDLFYFLVFLLFLVGSCFTLQPTKDKILNRDQTEEWKGWMQVMFVWYHYFAAKSWYNWIRVYIAAYVWMTGFGNFSFFWIRKDFSLWRVLKMLFRLNFLVIFVCIAVDNWYMLYYICPMHTYWFLSTYAFMAILPSWNGNRYTMGAKFVVYAVCNAIIFEIPNLHETIFRPFSFVLGFPDGKHDTMHEWAFRSGLDHWACFIGMLCAYNYPHFEALMAYLESASNTAWDRVIKVSSKVFLVVGAVSLFIFWTQVILNKPKYEYNRVHPYTSWIPIIVFIVLRNIHPVLRTHYVHLFAFLGKITLETYIAQLHIYLQSNAKELIGYIPHHPLLTFSAATIIYLLLSHQLFTITNHLSAWLFPKAYRDILIRLGLTSVVFFTAGVLAYIMRVTGTV